MPDLRAAVPAEPAPAESASRADRPLPRADGTAELGLAPAPGGARIAHLYQHSPLRLLFPRPAAGDPFLAALANTAGGVAGGDRLRLAVTVGEGAAALVTTQAAEKIYRSLGADSRIDTVLTVAPGAWLEWAPQEAILFDGARLRRSLTAEVAPGARLLAGEMLVFGRTARGERFRHGLLHEAWRVRRGGRLAWADALRLDGDIVARLDAPAGFGGAVACATVAYVAEDASAHLAAARALVEGAAGRAGATVVDGVLLARFLAAEAITVRRAVARYWAGLRAAAAGLPARLPRLWEV